ncbi:MAG: formate dehydrogenase accessory protein FdhE [Desulfurococcales archaeon]|nr:formate dehydrogenase accessory protein FdhE [Desulfurococcales archaeon]
MDNRQGFTDTLRKVAKRYNIDIDHSYAVKIESIQEAIRGKTSEYIEVNGIDVTLDNTLSVLDNILKEVDLNNEREIIKDILNSHGITDISYVELLIGQAILQSLSHILMEKNEPSENKTAICPVCGTETDQGFISNDGSIWLYCPLCGYTWKQSSLSHPVCPYCGMDHKEMIGVLRDKTNPTVVVMLCSNCKRYWILVDERYIKHVPRNLYPLLRSKAEKIIKSIPREFLGESK